MNYLKISNKGELDIRLISLMGGTTKANDPVKIGQFGTGLKYAISYMLRSKNNFRLFVGKEEVIFTTKPETIGDTQFEEIYCNGESMKISTHYGYQWQAWEAIREIWCNAKDEKGYGFKCIGQEEIENETTNNRTSFFIEITEEIEAVIKDWGKYFISEKPLFDGKDCSIYLNTGEHLKIYKNRILVKEDKYRKSLFNYDLKDCSLNELRQYIGGVEWTIPAKILSSNAEVVGLYLKNQKHDLIESKLEFWGGDDEHIRKIFAGYLFLHPDSDRSSSSKSIKVNKTLFEILKKAGLPTEKIHRQSGRSYGGGSYYEESEVEFRSVENPVLEKRIQDIASKYDSCLNFTLVQPRNRDFEVLTSEDDGMLINSDVFNYSEADLEATVLIGIMDERGVDMYKAMKRLIKFAQQSKSFEKILFGK